MTTLEAVGLYAGINLLILLVLAVNCSRGRMKHGISVGDDGNPQFLKTLRAHANAVEYIPAMLIALSLIAAMGAPALLIHAIGGPFTFGRLAHAQGMTAAGVGLGRRVGAMLTLLTFLIAALACIYYAVT